jgi:5'-methylthioadenosine phosphorylase
MPKIGIIAGSGFYEIEGVGVKELKKIQTPYGDPSDIYRVCEWAGIEFVFLSRHGTPHQIPPHRINYRANIWGFGEMGVERIISVNSVGGITKEMNPGDLVIPDQIMDMTQGRVSTFYDGPVSIHIDFTMPYCSELRAAVIRAGRNHEKRLRETGTYVCTNGPRLESKAEIRYFALIGADIVGMTGMPEASLARELEICFAGIAMVTNRAAGISDDRVTATEVVETMKSSMERVRNLILETLKQIPAERTCDCRNALKGAKL